MTRDLLLAAGSFSLLVVLALVGALLAVNSFLVVAVAAQP